VVWPSLRSGSLALEAGGVDGGDAAVILRRRRQICPAGGGRRVLGMVGASNVANETKEFKPNVSPGVGLGSGATGTREDAVEFGDDLVVELHLERVQCPIELLDGAGADDRRHHCRVA